MQKSAPRTADYPIDDIFLNRWSPRAFIPEAISERDLFTMFEAARWAASAYNAQPWRFLYARRDTPHWEAFLGLLVPGNRLWAQHASALVLTVSKTTITVRGEEKEVPSASHSYDTGTASGYFTLQASLLGLAAHGMGGYDKQRAVAELKIPSGFVPEVIYAVGRRGKPESLPPELQVREHPNTRASIDDHVFEGAFPA